MKELKEKEELSKETEKKAKTQEEAGAQGKQAFQKRGTASEEVTLSFTPGGTRNLATFFLVEPFHDTQ